MPSKILKQLVSEASRLPLRNATLSDAYYYSSLSLCLVDSIFSIGVRYAAVERVVARIVNAKGIEMDRRKCQIDPMPLREFVTLAKKSDPDILFANKHRTSSRNGILKSKAVVLAANALIAAGISTLADFQNASKQGLDAAEIGFRRVQGQGSGISWMYLQMLAGDDRQVKPDRHILRFINKATGENLSPLEAAELVRDCADALAKEYPKMTPRLLDHEIWKFESALRRRGRRGVS